MQHGDELATRKVFLLRGMLSRLLEHEGSALKVYAENGRSFRS